MKALPILPFLCAYRGNLHEGMLVFSLCELMSLIIVACCAQLLP